MQCSRKAAHGGQEPSTQDRTNQEDDKQKNYLKKDLTRLRLAKPDHENAGGFQSSAVILLYPIQVKK